MKVYLTPEGELEVWVRSSNNWLCKAWENLLQTYAHEAEVYGRILLGDL